MKQRANKNRVLTAVLSLALTLAMFVSAFSFTGIAHADSNDSANWTTDVRLILYFDEYLITGNVVDDINKQPLEGCKVTFTEGSAANAQQTASIFNLFGLLGTAHANATYETTTNASGYYKIALEEATSGTLTITKTNFTTESIDISKEEMIEGAVTKNAVLAKTIITISGKVIDKNGNAIANANVEFTDSDGKKYRTTTDANGNFSMDIPRWSDGKLVVSYNGDSATISLEDLKLDKNIGSITLSHTDVSPHSDKAKIISDTMSTTSSTNDYVAVMVAAIAAASVLLIALIWISKRRKQRR